MTKEIQYHGLVFEYRSVTRPLIFLHSTHMCVMIGIVHMISGLILNRVTSDTFSQNGCIGPARVNTLQVALMDLKIPNARSSYSV